MIIDDITLTDSIGKGSFAEVFLTTKKDSQTKYATKVYDLSEYKDDMKRRYLDNEISILKEVNHPNIIKLIEIKEKDNKMYVVTEYCNGGSLSEFFEKYRKENKPLSEEIVQYIMKQVIEGFKYLSSKDIIHRNIKLESLLINYEDENDRKNNNILKGQIKIISFAFSKTLPKGNLTYTILGSPIYMSPLLLKRLSGEKDYKKVGYDGKEDIWSIGILCYELLVGKTPFDSEDMDELNQKVNNGDYIIPITLSKETVSFLNCMLQDDPKKRSSYDLLSSHNFLTKNIKEFTKINLDDLKNIKVGMLVNIKNNESIRDSFGNGN